MARKLLGSRPDAIDEVAALRDVISQVDWTRPTGSIRQTLDRRYLLTNTLAALSTGRLSMQAIWLNQGETITSISVISGTTAAVTPTNQFFGLYDASRNLVGVSANNTTTAWGASTVKTLNLTTPYVVPTSGLYYIGVMVTAGTVPTLQGSQSSPSSVLGNASGTAPIISGTSNTGLTTSLPNPATAITSSGVQFWAYVS